MTRRVALGCSATFAGAFDFGFMTLAAPALDRDLALGAAYPWIFSAGSLAYGASVMPAAALSGRISAHRLLATGLLLAAGGAIVVACASGAAGALAGRALFGLGGGIAAAPALALLAAIEPPSVRRAAFARLGASVTLGFTSGVLLAALVPTWRGVLLVLAAALAFLAAAARTPRPGKAPLRGAGGAWWFGGATVAVTVALALASAAPAAAALTGAGAIGIARAGWRRATWLPEARVATLALCAAGAATTASGVGATVLVGRTLSDADGLVLAAFGAAVPPATALARRSASTIGSAGSAGLGLALQAGAIAALGLATDDPLALALPLVAFGAGHVLASAGAADALTALAGRHAAQTGGLLITAQFAGGGAGALLVLATADATTPALALTLAAAIAAAGALTLLARSGVLARPA